MTEELDFVKRALDDKQRPAPNGEPYWTARELMAVLGYTNWANFKNAIERAKMACEQSGISPDNQFVDASEMVDIGSGAQRAIEDFILSKYACYLMAMNGDPEKSEIATAQTYFAVQTHRQETQDALTDTERRLLLRNRVKDANKTQWRSEGCGREEHNVRRIP